MGIGDPEPRSVTLVSNGTGTWTDGTVIDLHWTYIFLGGRAGLYKAYPVNIEIRLPSEQIVSAVYMHILERAPRSGKVLKEEHFQFQLLQPAILCKFHWDSTVDIPEQEVTFSVATNDRYDSNVLLRDPISRRRNFLISLSC
jgi:hypothetical protein